MTDKERLLAGSLYNPFCVNTRWEQVRKAVKAFNESCFWKDTKPLEELKELFGSVGEDVILTPPFYCDHGDKITIGSHFYANTGLTILDANCVSIGDHVFFGPHVSIYTATHPISANIRNTGLECAKAITIGNNVWLGGNVVINPGVSVGDNTVIASGSVVTKDIPGGVIAGGNPCRVLRKITQADHDAWQKQYENYKADQDTDCEG